jgi:hypothetical protein
MLRTVAARAGARSRHGPDAKQCDRVDVGSVLDRQPLMHCAPHQRAFVALDREQVALHLGFLLLARFMRQCGGVVALAVYLCIEPLGRSYSSTIRVPSVMVSSRCGCVIEPRGSRYISGISPCSLS